MNTTPRTYTSLNRPMGFFHEGAQLFRRSLRTRAHLAEEVSRLIEACRIAEQFLLESTGVRIENLRALEIGPGQLPRQLAYFASKNDVTAIDLDVIPHGWDASAYLRLARQNGIKRLFKTVARKVLGVDRAFNREMCRQLGLERLPQFTLLQMDATAMTFLDESFDLVYSFDVMEHLPDPGAVLRHIARVLRPGGASLHYIHPYTADDGSHDLRITFGRRGDLPYWPHLRPQSRANVREFAFLNRLTLNQWRELLQQHLPGSMFMLLRADDPNIAAALSDARHAGELREHSDEELLTARLIAVWQKPRSNHGS